MSGGFIPPSPSAASSITLRDGTPAPAPLHTALSAAQERRLIGYLDDHFLSINRAYKKRHEPDAPLPSLLSYISAFRPLLALILQIPPLDPSAALRVSYLLRLTGDFTDTLPGYGVPLSTAGDTLDELVSFLTHLDKGWQAVLSSERWDPASHTGVPMTGGESGALSRPVSATDKIRLRSILQSGRERIEQWARGVVHVDPGTEVDVASSFWRTLAALGDVPLPERGGDMEDEDAKELLEVVMVCYSLIAVQVLMITGGRARIRDVTRNGSPRILPPLLKGNLLPVRPKHDNASLAVEVDRDGHRSHTRRSIEDGILPRPVIDIISFLHQRLFPLLSLSQPVLLGLLPLTFLLAQSLVHPVLPI
ncbi:hypothetical protein DACRYDRAFT_45973 [Dacryopinax primogenitus]|uniref:Uncharacterized protein n=1 Tax=Dacryopinax primogenitus (strain DJM 731) TaxID=1858805 RepID=M5GEZ4_DACPD|nr:uncharacterized protein DACRYDRAFT_45973 [Dacryopinax primogenitus]EJU05847.1 hypothetical protein DACRYDRAFT_45973 [Dacryopinax primogenitus]